MSPSARQSNNSPTPNAGKPPRSSTPPSSSVTSRRQEREGEHVQQAADDAKQAAIAAGPISRDNAYMVYKEAADAERVRFELREPRLDFQEWLDAGKPAVHEIGVIRDLQAHRLEAGATS